MTGPWIVSRIYRGESWFLFAFIGRDQKPQFTHYAHEAKRYGDKAKAKEAANLLRGTVIELPRSGRFQVVEEIVREGR